MKSLPWSSNLLELLIEELYIDDSLEELLGERLQDLPRRRYPQAIALALALRHSWRADDLASILEQLCPSENGCQQPSRTQSTRSPPGHVATLGGVSAEDLIDAGLTAITQSCPTKSSS